MKRILADELEETVDVCRQIQYDTHEKVPSLALHDYIQSREHVGRRRMAAVSITADTRQ